MVIRTTDIYPFKVTFNNYIIVHIWKYTRPKSIVLSVLIALLIPLVEFFYSSIRAFLQEN